MSKNAYTKFYAGPPVGFVVGIIVFIMLALKGWNLLFNSIIVTLIICLFSWINPLETLTGVYMPAFADFVNTYLFIFVLSAVYGKVMEASGCVRKIAISLSKLTTRSKKHAKFFTVLLLPLFYLILSYVGISGFVVVFTVLAIGRELFEMCDIPWKFYTYGSAGVYPAFVLGGSINATNVMAANIFSEGDLFAGMGISVVATIVIILMIMLLVWLDVRKAEKKGVGFLPTGAALKESLAGNNNSSSLDESELPNLLLAVIPLVAPIVCLVAGLHVVVSLTVAVLICVLTNVKKFTNIKVTLKDGILGGTNALVNCCGALGFVTVFRSTAGFGVLTGMLDNLPPLFAAIGLGFILSAASGTSTSWMGGVSEMLVQKYTEAGMSMGVSHRLACLSNLYFMPPHNTGSVNAVSLGKLNYVTAAKIYFKITFIPGVVALIVCIALVQAGVFV